MSKQSDNLTRLGVEAPSGDLTRDLKDHKRVLLRRGQPCTRVLRAPEMGDRVLRFICSTDGIKRDGNRVRNDPGSWDFTNFAKNPVMLWTHDYGSSERPPMPPIGSWVEWSVEPDGSGSNSLVMSGRFATHEFADLVYNLYLEGHMRAVSIGWTPLEYREIVENGSFLGWDFFRNELLECSAVPIPADPDAIMVAAQRGMIPEAAMERFANWTHPSRGVAYVLDPRDRSRDVEPKQERKEEEARMDDTTLAPETAAPEDPGVTCGRCGAVNATGARYCSACGASLMAEEPAAEPAPSEEEPMQEPMVVVEQAMTTCSHCGAEIPMGANYCPGCGMAVAVSEESPVGSPPPAAEAPAEVASAEKPSERKSGGATDAGMQSRVMLANCMAMADEAKKVMHWCDTMYGDEQRDDSEDIAAGIISAANVITGLANNILQTMQSIALMVTQPEGEYEEEEMAETDPVAPAAEEAPATATAGLRVGKKIAGSRLSKLQGAHDTIGTGLSDLASVLKEVIDDGERKAPALAEDPELIALRERVEALVTRKEVLSLRRRIESLVERKERLKNYAAQVLPTVERRK